MENEQINQILNLLEELNRRVSHIESKLTMGSKLNPEVAPRASREESFMEFFKRYRPEKETDKTLVIMHFLETRRHISNITSKNISEGFREVREKIPTNVADKIQMLHKGGMIMPGEMVENLKGWLITSTGLDYLEKLENENKN